MKSRIVCLGWGSLIWQNKGLPIASSWEADGPVLSIEFLRRSRDGRITLVVDETNQTPPVPVLWSLMKPITVESAVHALGVREDIPAEMRKSRIGTWNSGDDAPHSIPTIADWARSHAVDAVVWTALSCKYFETNDRPTCQTVINHLRNLCGKVRDDARRYVEKAPRQIRTPYRDQIENCLGWYPQSDV